MTKFAVHALLVFALCIACLLQPPLFAAEPALKSGIDKANFDHSVKPGDDFFQHVNGEWIKHNPIPPEYSRWGAFPKLRDDNLIALHEILEELVNTKEDLNEERTKLRDFYQTAMDEAAVQKRGMSPLEPALKRIDSIKSKNDLIAEVARLREDGIGTLFSFYVDQDEKQSDRYAAQIGQGGMGLPDRDYYVGTSKDSKRIRDLYREHVAKMLGLLGDSPEAAAAGADTVLRIETKLAEKSRTPTQLRDREANYNKESLTDLATLAPSFDWNLYLDTIDVRDAKYVIVGQPEFLERMNELVGSVPLKDWQTYLRWHLVHEMAPYLSKPFEDESFRFYSQELRGVKEMQPRWKRVVAAIDGEIGEALGKIYVEKHFPPLAKKRMDELVKNLMAAYRERLEGRDWMGPKTKKLALAKLDAVFPKIGYPSKWRDYSDLKIGRDSYAANVMRAEAFESRYRFNKIGKAVDRTEWHMTPPTVNAYYNPTMNEIVFPAGILQPPFFDMTADDAVNYGGIGAVIGHEITHGFDDQGSRSDARGNLVNWWTDEDRKQFTAKTDKLVKQYDACEVLDGLHVNGELTLGENIADLGGITIAYAAYQKSLGGKAAPKIDGFTGPQRFFMGFAQVWRGSSRDAQMRLMIRTDPHSPPQFRTNVPLSNIKAFYDAFGIKPGHTMYREPSDRVEVW
jgi:putative endopeptidase